MHLAKQPLEDRSLLNNFEVTPDEDDLQIKQIGTGARLTASLAMLGVCLSTTDSTALTLPHSPNTKKSLDHEEMLNDRASGSPELLKSVLKGAGLISAKLLREESDQSPDIMLIDDQEGAENGDSDIEDEWIKKYPNLKSGIETIRLFRKAVDEFLQTYTAFKEGKSDKASLSSKYIAAETLGERLNYLFKTLLPLFDKNEQMKLKNLIMPYIDRGIKIADELKKRGYTTDDLNEWIYYPSGSIKLTDENFLEETGKKTPILVQVYTVWCPACTSSADEFLKFVKSQDSRGIRTGSLNIQNTPKTRDYLERTKVFKNAIPVYLLFENGKCIRVSQGAFTSPEEIEAFLKQSSSTEDAEKSTSPNERLLKVETKWMQVKNIIDQFLSKYENNLPDDRVGEVQLALGLLACATSIDRFVYYFDEIHSKSDKAQQKRLDDFSKAKISPVIQRFKAFVKRAEQKYNFLERKPPVVIPRSQGREI